MKPAEDVPVTAAYPHARLAWTTVAILMVAYVLSFIDRQILNLLVAPVRRDLDISDTQMSYLLGLSFALFYTVCGIPIGRLADVKSRRGIIAVGIVFWSLMTAGCGMARSYLSFLLFRIGVGVGEATLSPSAYSLIADSFPKQTRATAISVYACGIYIGSGLAFLVGGQLIFGFSAEASTDKLIRGALQGQRAAGEDCRQTDDGQREPADLQKRLPPASSAAASTEPPRTATMRCTILSPRPDRKSVV